MKSEITNHKTATSIGRTDYYLAPEVLTVFTEKYHLKRDFCCKRGYSYCPYGFRKLK